MPASKTPAPEYWTFCGRYGDRNERVLARAKPADLPATLQAALKKLYLADKRGIRGDADAELERLGLICEVDNAWHTNVVFAPSVHEWMKARDTSHEVKTALQQQFST